MFRVLEALPVVCVVGDTGAIASVVADFDSDPGGVDSADFYLWKIGADAPVVVPDATHSIAPFGSVYRLQLESLLDADLSDNVGLNFGRFVVTFTDGGVLTLPPDDRLLVKVMAAAPEPTPP